MALPLYALTLFVSAFILFLVQPIVGKIILPKLGGTPQVWNTCMVFFQMVLLAGYAYTHNASTRLTLRQQLVAHLVLLALPFIVLLPFPFAFGGEFTSTGDANPNSLWGFRPDLGSNPIPSTLVILFLYVALPFLVVATTAPLLQKWFVYTGHPASKDPYFLYGASNLGSMLSLIIYPALIEPNFALKTQGWIYTVGYITLAVFVLACAAMVWGASEPKREPQPKMEPKTEPAPMPQTSAPAAETGVAAGAPAPVPAPAAATSVKPGQPKPGKGAAPPRTGGGEPSIALPQSDEVTGWRRFRWIMLAAIPSSLMLGITTHITTDLSPQPMFWLVPLILYLASFIFVFARWPVVWTEGPHYWFVWAQPFFIALMIIVDILHLTNDTSFLVFAMFAHVMGFFTTTMVCHGELAKDRPGTKHLTEFYLMMSVGGMLGGMFNALFAPVVFQWGTWEFPIAILAAALARPKMFETGLLDNWFANLFEGQAQPTPAPKPGQKGKPAPAPASRGEVTANDQLVRTFDFVWPVIVLVVLFGMMFLRGTVHMGVGFAVALMVACLGLTRPLRFGLSIGAILLMHGYMTQDPSTLAHRRSFFGAMSVKEIRHPDYLASFRQLIHGHIDHGMNFLPPEKAADKGNPEKDFSRMATTYYHREGPAGRVMEMKKFNFFPGDRNTYAADARMPATLATSIMGDIGLSPLPLSTLVSAWSERPYATIGLGTGTMASYGRPYQHVHFYEIDNVVRRFSLAMPTQRIQDFKQYEKDRDTAKPTYFGYLENAIKRGCSVQVLMGDARLRMALPYQNHYRKDKEGNYLDENDPGGGPEKFYHMMVVDAFSSDAIPAHLLTKEAFHMYFDRLADDGILCVHTSNRFVDLPKVVAAIADAEGWAYLRGHDVNDDRRSGHYTSEWVMVARKAEHLAELSGDTDFLTKYAEAVARKSPRRAAERYWERVSSDPRYVWTDDYYNLLSVVRFGLGRRD